MENFSSLALKLKEEFEVKDGQHFFPADPLYICGKFKLYWYFKLSTHSLWWMIVSQLFRKKSCSDLKHTKLFYRQVVSPGHPDVRLCSITLGCSAWYFNNNTTSCWSPELLPWWELFSWWKTSGRQLHQLVQWKSAKLQYAKFLICRIYNSPNLCFFTKFMIHLISLFTKIFIGQIICFYH